MNFPHQRNYNSDYNNQILDNKFNTKIQPSSNINPSFYNQPYPHNQHVFHNQFEQKHYQIKPLVSPANLAQMQPLPSFRQFYSHHQPIPTYSNNAFRYVNPVGYQYFPNNSGIQNFIGNKELQDKMNSFQRQEGGSVKKMKSQFKPLRRTDEEDTSERASSNQHQWIEIEDLADSGDFQGRCKCKNNIIYDIREENQYKGDFCNSWC